MSGQINIGSLVAELELNTTRFDRAAMNAESGIYQIRSEITALQAQFHRGEITIAQYTDRLAYLTEAQNQLVVAMNSTSIAAANARRNIQGVTSAAQGMQNGFARAAMQVGYMADDIQYGFRSIVNNIAPLAEGIARFAGASQNAAMLIASATQIAAVLAFQLYNNWDRVMDSMGLGKIRTEAEEMDELGKKTKKTADETERLNKYKKEQSDIQRLMENRPDKEEKQAKVIQNIIAESDSKKVINSLVHGMEQDGTGEHISPQEQAEIDKARKNINRFSADPVRRGKADAALQAIEDRINLRINQANIKRAQKLLVSADDTDDPQSLGLRSLISKVKRNPKAYKDGLLQQLMGQLPENKAKKDAFIKEAEAGEEAFNLKDKRQKQEIKDKDQADKDARQAGLEGQAELKRKKDEDLKRAKDENPEINPMAKTLVAATMMGDISAEEARQRIIEQLKGNDSKFKEDMDKAIKTADTADDETAAHRAQKRAELAADDVLDTANDDITKRISEAVNNPKSAKNAEQFSAMDLAAKVQAGVGDTEAKKHTTYLAKAVDLLANIAGKNQNAFEVVN